MSSDGKAQSAADLPDRPLVDTEGIWWVSPLTPDDRERVAEICEAEWGFIPTTFLDNVVGGPANFSGHVARTETGVVGVALQAYYDSDEMERHLRPANVDCSTGERFSYLHLLAVDSEWQSQGIGSALVRRWLDRSNPAYNVTHAVAVSWHRDDHHDSRTVFEKFGLRELVTVEEYYSVGEWTRTTCPDCPAECRCDASVFCKRVKPQETDE